MRTRAQHIILLCGIALGSALLATQADAGWREQMLAKRQSRYGVRYDFESDTIRTTRTRFPKKNEGQEAEEDEKAPPVVQGPPRFHYLGKPGTGGIYDALREYKLRRKLDPRHYRYGW